MLLMRLLSLSLLGVLLFSPTPSERQTSFVEEILGAEDMVAFPVTTGSPHHHS